MAASYNYYAHRQFYINGLTETDVPTDLQDNETAVTEAIRRISPICKYDNVKPFWLYSENGDSVSTEPRMFAFRNGSLLYKKALEYFKIERNVQNWERKDTAIITISDWGYKSKSLEGEYEFFVFDENGFLINNSYNSFFIEITGVLYGVLINCENWPGMNTDGMEGYTRSKTVSVIAVRKNNNIPYAALPNCTATNDYDIHAMANSETSALPHAMNVSWSASSGWSGYTEENYGMLITLGEEMDFSDVDFTGRENYKDTIIEILNSMIKNKVCFEVPLYNGENKNYELTVTGGMLGITWNVKDVEGLGIEIEVPFGFVEETLEEGSFTFKLTKLPRGSQFWFSNRALQFVDEIRMTGTKIPSNENITPAEGREDDPDYKVEYSLTSRAFPCGLGTPFFDKNHGLAYIPLGKCFGNVEDYHEIVNEDEDLTTNLFDNPKAYEKIGGSVDGLHNFPILKPKAEDVFVFVGNRYGMVKLTPYVDYTIEECGPISGSMPVIMLQGRSEHEGEPYDEHAAEFNVLNRVQRTFPNPIPTPEDSSDYKEYPNEEVFIRVFYGYPKGKISTYWGPNENVVNNRANQYTYQNEVAENGLSIANTVESINGASYCYHTDDNKLIATAKMVDDESLPWSILPREDFLEFDAGKYKVLSKAYKNRILFDRTFALNTGKFRDVELHALIDEKYGIANTLWNQQASTFDGYFDKILEILDVTDREVFARKAVEKDYAQTQDEENNPPAFYYLLNNGNQIHESLNVEDWLTWLTDIDDRTDEVYDGNAD